MPIAGSMDQWRGRMKLATDDELAILDQDSDPTSPLRSVVSDEILRRSAAQGAAITQAPLAVTPAPDAPNIPVTIPTAPPALSTVPPAPQALASVTPPPKVGGSGPPPSDPVTLANRAYTANEGGDQGTALEIYEWGVENHGQAFKDAFEAVKQKHEKPEGGLPAPPAGNGYYTSLGGVPRGPLTTVPVRGAALPEPPEPAPYLPQGADAAVAGAVRDAELATTQYRADQQAAANAAKATTLGAATRDAKALIEQGLTPGQAVTEALKQPGVGTVVSANDLRTSLGLPAEAPAQAPPAAAPPPPASDPALAGMSRPPTGRGPLTTAAGTAYGQMRLDDPNVAAPPQTSPPPVDRRYGRQPDGTYIDMPPGGEVLLPEDTVTIVRETGQPARKAGDPRGGTGTASSTLRSVDPPRSMAAPPDSGGLPSTVQPPPAVDIGTNTSPAAKPTSTVDTGTNTPQSDDSGFMGKPDIWSFLTSAGLGMMSSQSPNFLGAVGAGGTAGVQQLGVLRKDQRERNKNLADAEFQKKRIELGYHDTNAANQRSDNQIRSNEKINTQNNQGQADRQRVDIGARREELGTRLQYERDQAERNSQLKIAEAEFADSIRDRNLIDDPETRFNWSKSKGASDEDARNFAFGHAPQTEKTPTFSPMGEKETTLAIDLVANSQLGQGRSGEELLAQLPPHVASEFKLEIGKAQSPAEGAARGEAVLKKHGIISKDTSFFNGAFGEERNLVIPKTAPAPAAAGGGGGGGGGAYVWDEVNKRMVPK